jgi:hypothetical protein
MPTGKCHCGAIRYSIDGELKHSAICHCETCRRTTGGLTTAWLGYPKDALAVEGEASVYSSSEGVERHFCGTCGTSLFYFNEPMMPGVADVLTVTLDEPATCPPTLHVNMGDAIAWEVGLDDLPKFERFPGQ